jgi:hypothetical protein
MPCKAADAAMAQNAIQNIISYELLLAYWLAGCLNTFSASARWCDTVKPDHRLPERGQA